ncbi:MAG: hypothetical protein N2385_14560, partial [Chloroflexus sp.]|nr:hypothetical protein [Chloroflexus sp.]
LDMLPVSIRYADFCFLQPPSTSPSTATGDSFNPRCGFLFFATSSWTNAQIRPVWFQSAMRIFVFCNLDAIRYHRVEIVFQSAMRIFVFCNLITSLLTYLSLLYVSIRDADFCFLQPATATCRPSENCARNWRVI